MLFFHTSSFSPSIVFYTIPPILLHDYLVTKTSANIIKILTIKPIKITTHHFNFLFMKDIAILF